MKDSDLNFSQWYDVTGLVIWSVPHCFFGERVEVVVSLGVVIPELPPLIGGCSSAITQQSVISGSEDTARVGDVHGLGSF